MSPSLVRHGWEITFQPQLFARQYAELKAEVKRLKQELEPQAFVSHPPGEAACGGDGGDQGAHRRYGRLKGLGLPDRYRLFFSPFEAKGRRLLLIVWLGYPRKDGDRNDCYAVFTRMVQRGELPEDWESLQRELDSDPPSTGRLRT
jgi:toxin YhaV